MTTLTRTTADPQEPPALRMALRLLDMGFWPVPIRPLDPGDGKSSGKRPIGVDWGMSRHTADSLRRIWRQYPDAGVGIKLGKKAGVVDLDVDDPETGDDTFTRVVGGEQTETFGWSSERGYHALFRWDDRLAKYGAVVRGHPNYPGLELRFGGDETSDKQYQTVVPPSPDTRGIAREWNRIWEVADLPECAFADFEANLSHHETTPVSVPTASPLGLVVSAPAGGMDIVERARRYIAKMPESVAGQRGHDRLYHVAAVLVGDFLLREEQALPLLREWNQFYARPPESDKQIVHKLADAYKHADMTGRLVDPKQSMEQVIAEGGEAAGGIEGVATLADIALVQAGIEWIWPGWIQRGVLCLFAAKAGEGKTRLCADLARRIWHGLPWPDGSPSTFPARTPVLWVPADGNHGELVTLFDSYGVPQEACYLNAAKSDPFAGTELSTREQYAALEWNIRCVRPAFVAIDTITNTTSLKAHDASDAKQQYKPLQEIAQRTGTAIICVTHLNASGGALGRRAPEKVRTVIQMTLPDPDNQPHRRRLWVEKSNSLKPEPMGVTMATGGNEYDFDPPKAPEDAAEVVVGGGGGAPRHAAPNRLAECVAWLVDTLSPGPARVFEIRNQATANGFSSKTAYEAKRRLNLDEYESQGVKWWRLTNTN